MNNDPTIQYTKRRYLFAWVLAILFCANCKIADGQPAKTNAQKEDLLLADPHIFFHDGIYYLYGTGNSSQGFLVYTSVNMRDWQGPKGRRDGFALRKGDAFGNSKFWAPQVFRYHDRFYMAYAADEHIAIASGDSPLGPFSQTSKTPLASAVKQIDPFVFIDEDDKKYLYYVQVADGGNRIFVSEMTDDFSATKPQTTKECIRATEAWENSENAGWSVAEGPTVIRHKGGFYYLLYSANHFNSPDYAVGYAVSESPYGPWEKYQGNPILSKAYVGKNGTGHGDIFENRKGEMFYVFHTHQSITAVGPRRTAMVNIGFLKNDPTDIDTLRIEPKTFRFLDKAE
jgi:beta-xylosidase